MSENQELIIKIERSLSNGLEFLYQSQLPHGEFRTYASPHKMMVRDCVYDSSPFVTALVLYCISFLKDQRVKEMTEKALHFFLMEMKGQGVWHYWTSSSGRRIPPDLDDIACISYILKKNCLSFPSNIELILANRNEDGVFRTWIVDLLTVMSSPKWTDWSRQVDCVVNANVLFYMGESDDTRKAISYLNSIITNNEEEGCSQHYPDRFSFYYMLSRAYFNGVSSLEKSKGLVIERVMSTQQVDGSFGDELQTALAVSTLLNFGYQDPGMSEAIECILKTQGENGSWARVAMYLGPAPYYGSEELTTAINIEALARSSQTTDL